MYTFVQSTGTRLTDTRHQRMPMALIGYILIVVGVAFGAFMLGSIAVGAGFQPTPRKKVVRMLEMSGAGPSDVVYDLGSGDGRVVVEAAEGFHARAVGVEADPVRFLVCRLSVAMHHLQGRVRVVWGNFFHIDLSEATIVTVFLSQGTNQRLKTKLMSELRPGAKVVSYVWTFDEWTPRSTDPENNISLYVV